MIKVCEECAAEFTAQRSTRRYCSEACKQRAKRARERAGEWAAPWQHVLAEAKCQWCGGLLFPDKPEHDNVRLALAHPWWTHRRKYCTHQCRSAARRYRYRVAHQREDAPYRVADTASDPYALAEPAPCWRSAEWHELARSVLAAMEKGWVLTPPLDQEHLGAIDLTLAREIVASQHSGPSPGDACADREPSLCEQEDPASPDAAPDSGSVQAAPPTALGVQTTQRPADDSVSVNASDSCDDLWEKILNEP